MKTILIKDFLPGDIILYKVNPNEWISEAIGILTKSDVSHAQLYMGNSIISDMGLEGLKNHQVSNVKVDSWGNLEPAQTYVRRLEKPKDKEPVLEAAKKYISQDEPYDMAGLVLLGLILLYRDYPVHLLPVNLVTYILTKAAAAIDEYIAEQRHPGKKPMVCSQYVFQCYEDAGEGYNLHIENPIIPSSNLGKEPKLFIGRVYEAIKDSPKEWIGEQNYAISAEKSDEEMGSDFVKALQEINSKEQVNLIPNSLTLDDDLIKSVLHFSDKLYNLMHKEANDISSVEKLCHNAAKEPNSLFVTPEDLKACTDLTDIGESTIYRGPEPANV